MSLPFLLFATCSRPVDPPHPHNIRGFAPGLDAPTADTLSRGNVNGKKWDDSANKWISISEGTTVGYKRILRFPAVTTQKLRLHINDALASPTLNHIGLFNAPELARPE